MEKYKQPKRAAGHAVEGTQKVEELNISVGSISGRRTKPASPETKIRGTGAATKGMKARGPMG